MEAANRAVRAQLVPTPLIAAELPTPLGPVQGWLKLESLQPTGSFKVRGALAALGTLGPDDRAVSASAGNHALGMAWASTHTGVPVTVVTPETASAAKVEAIEALTRAPASTVTLVQYGLSYDEAEVYATGLVATEPAATYISPYGDYAVIAGASTIGAEIGEALPDLSLTIVAGLGGGGLCSGLALYAGGHGDADVVAVEASSSRAVSSAVAAGQVVTVPIGPTIADGLAGNLEPHSPTPQILGQAIASERATTATVDDDEIRAAMRWLFAAHGIVAEGAGAAATAAVLAGRVKSRVGEGLVVVVSGRNITAEDYAHVLTS